LEQLLARADAVVCGYRPGALDRFGLTDDALAARHPGVVVIYLDAWGHVGPWQHRRGFDSVVQAPTGIASAESVDGGGPARFRANCSTTAPAIWPQRPCSTACIGKAPMAELTSAGSHWPALRPGSLLHARLPPRTSRARLCLARCVSLGCVSLGFRRDGTPPWLVELDSADGPIGAVAPPGALGDRPLQWPSPLTGYGNDPPDWSL
jgi:hypothetical protein